MMTRVIHSLTLLLGFFFAEMEKVFRFVLSSTDVVTNLEGSVKKFLF